MTPSLPTTAPATHHSPTGSADDSLSEIYICFRLRQTIHALYSSMIRELLHCRRTASLFAEVINQLSDLIGVWGVPRTAPMELLLSDISARLRTAVKGLRLAPMVPAPGQNEDNYRVSRDCVFAFAVALQGCRLARERLTEYLSQNEPVWGVGEPAGEVGLWERVATGRWATAQESRLRELASRLDDRVDWHLGWVRWTVGQAEQVDKVEHAERDAKVDRPLCLLTRNLYLLTFLLALADPERLTRERLARVYRAHADSAKVMRPGFMRDSTEARLASLATYFPPPFDSPHREYGRQAVKQVKDAAREAIPAPTDGPAAQSPPAAPAKGKQGKAADGTKRSRGRKKKTA